MSSQRLSTRGPVRAWWLMFVWLIGLPALANNPADLSALPAVKAHAGKVILLDFWASWCAPCRQSFPWMSDLQRRYGRDRFAVVAVNVDQDKALAERFLRKTPGDFQILYDPRGELATRLNVQGMPTSYLIDRDGRQRAVHKGFRDGQRAAREKEIENLLSEGTGK